MVTVKQKETFFQDQACRVIFIEDFAVEEKLGQQEIALQV